MDYNKHNRNLKIAVVVLVIMNVAALTLLWLGRPVQRGDFSNNERGNNERIHSLLIDELGLTKAQADEYIKYRTTNKAKIKKLHNELLNIKKEMFDSVLEESNSTTTDSLLSEMLNKQEKIEYTTIEHFQKLKSLCTKEQQIKLIDLMRKIIGPPEPPRPNRNRDKEMGSDMPPPPPDGAPPFED